MRDKKDEQDKKQNWGIVLGVLAGILLIVLPIALYYMPKPKNPTRFSIVPDSF